MKLQTMEMELKTLAKGQVYTVKRKTDTDQF